MKLLHPDMWSRLSFSRSLQTLGYRLGTSQCESRYSYGTSESLNRRGYARQSSVSNSLRVESPIPAERRHFKEGM